MVVLASHTITGRCWHARQPDLRCRLEGRNARVVGAFDHPAHRFSPSVSLRVRNDTASPRNVTVLLVCVVHIEYFVNTCPLLR